MPTKPPLGGKPEGKRIRLSNEEIRVLVRVIGAITAVGEKFGVAFVVFLILLATVWFLGTAQTQDAFLRELLFGSITNTRYLAVFFVALIIVAIFGIDTRVQSYRTETAEMKRLADERTKWQQRALNAPLSHTEEAD